MTLDEARSFDVAQLTTTDNCAIINGVTEVPVSTVTAGYRFQLALSTGKLLPGTVIRHTPCSTAVILDGLETERSFVTAEGETVTLKRQGGVQHWAPTTPVIRIDGSRDITKWTNPGAVFKSYDQGEETMEAATEKTASLLGGGGSRPARKMSRKAAKAKAAGKAKAAPREKKVKELNPCKCGCGDKVTGNFRQGHDARYYGLLKKVVAEIQPFNSLPKLMQNEAENVAGCKRLLASHGKGKK